MYFNILTTSWEYITFLIILYGIHNFFYYPIIQLKSFSKKKKGQLFNKSLEVVFQM